MLSRAQAVELAVDRPRSRSDSCVIIGSRQHIAAKRGHIDRSQRAGAIDSTSDARNELLEELDRWLEWPMLLLAFAWLALFVVEMLRGLTPVLTALGYAIWAMFAFQFVLELLIAPRKLAYLRHNTLTLIALALPGLRLLRLVRLAQLARLSRAAGAMRGARLLRLVTSVNRGMRALRMTMSRRGFGYVVLLTFAVTLGGAAGMYAFERDAFDSFWTALWWTAMLITTIGSQYWPESAEGRVLCLFLAVYGLAMFGYVTAALASFFIGRDAESEKGESVGPREVELLRRKIAALTKQLHER